MSIINIQTVQTGLVGVLPSLAYIDTSSTEAAILTAGFLNKEVANGAQFSLPCIAVVSTQETPTAAKQVGWYQVTHSGANWSLIPAGNPGDVVLPTIANHIATYTNTTGTLSEDAATAINGGNIQAGLSGTAGYLASFPGTAAKGSLRLTAVANTGDTLVTLSNALHGQASVYSIPDSGAATANILVSKLTGTQHITVGAFQVDAGVISAGISTGGTAGGFIAYPATTTTGSLRLTPVSNVGNFAASISNIVGLGQATVYTLPDPGAATANILVSASAGGQTIAGGLTISTGNLGVSAGNVSAGSSGNAGSLISFPATAANGTLIISALNAGGAFNTTIRNSVMGQSTVYSMGDIGAATGGIVVATSALLMKSVAAAAAAGGAAAQSFSDAFCTSGSMVVGNWNTQANAASVLKIVPGNGSFVVTSSADAGVGTFNYIITK